MCDNASAQLKVGSLGGDNFHQPVRVEDITPKYSFEHTYSQVYAPTQQPLWSEGSFT